MIADISLKFTSNYISYLGTSSPSAADTFRTCYARSTHPTYGWTSASCTTAAAATSGPRSIDVPATPETA